MSTRKLRRKYRPSSSSNSISGKNRIVRRALTHRREIDHGKTWFCIRTVVGCERRVALGLREAGFDIYRPVDDRWRVHKHVCSDISLGWFGSYIFAGAIVDEERPFRFGLLRNVDGVHSILGAAGTPMAVAAELLQSVADRIAGFRKLAPAAFKRGQKVVIQRGPFAELMAEVLEVYPENAYARAAVEMFGKTHELELDFVELKAA